MKNETKYCDKCFDGENDTVFPYYGLAPHVHNGLLNTEFTGEYPANFEPEEDGAESGIYTHCLACGAGQPNNEAA